MHPRYTIAMHRHSVSWALFCALLAASCGRSDLEFAQLPDGGVSPQVDSESNSLRDTALDAREDTAIDAADTVPATDTADTSTPPVDAPPGSFSGSVVADVYGNVVYFNNGNPIPAGTCTITYAGGCMQYAPGYGWTVHEAPPGIVNGASGFWLVTTSGATRISMLPGNFDYQMTSTGYATFDACMTANFAQDTPMVVQWPGGVLGVWLEDYPYNDNTGGPGGDNPTWDMDCTP